MEELFKRVRMYNEETDKHLPTFSYSKLDVYKQCPAKYKLRYVDKKYETVDTLATELGTLCHYILEQKGKCINGKREVDFNMLKDILYFGAEEQNLGTISKKILGVNDLKKKYFEEYSTPDKFNVTYNEKLQLFQEKVLKEEMQDENEWAPVYFEFPFKIVYDDRIVLHGFIDRIDQNTKGEYRVVDYKTSKAVFDLKELPTSMQFGIYAMAAYCYFETVPVEYLYRFILIDKKQNALSKGWEKRLVKALDKILDKIEAGVFNESPTPLCYWCNFSGTEKANSKYHNECNKYSLWTPTNKSFMVYEKPVGNNRKIIF